MRLLVVVGLLLVSTTTAYACSKEWIKLMVMNVCSYSKRHVSASEIPKEEWTMQEIDSQFTRIYGDLDDDESLWKMEESGESTESKKPERSRKNRMKRYSMLNDNYYSLGVLDRFLKGYDTVEEQRVETKQKIKRQIRTLIEKCCKQVCTVDDFRGICH